MKLHVVYSLPEGVILRTFGRGCGVLETFMYFIPKHVILKFLQYCRRPEKNSLSCFRKDPRLLILRFA